MLRARAGEIQLPKIVGFVFGDGGVDADGNVIAPLEAESELKNELLRKKYDTYTMLSDTKCKYECELKESELPGAAISEIGLYDADGDIVTIKRFTAKGKDADIVIMDNKFVVQQVFVGGVPYIKHNSLPAATRAEEFIEGSI